MKIIYLGSEGSALTQTNRRMYERMVPMILKYITDDLPEYYPTMYLDGYTPEQIFAAAHNSMINRNKERHQVSQIKITSEVKIKK